jgi:hypothetical protein
LLFHAGSPEDPIRGTIELCSKAGTTTREEGKLSANAWGLFDMLGNAQEPGKVIGSCFPAKRATTRVLECGFGLCSLRVIGGSRSGRHGHDGCYAARMRGRVRRTDGGWRAGLGFPRFFSRSRASGAAKLSTGKRLPKAVKVATEACRSRAARGVARRPRSCRTAAPRPFARSVSALTRTECGNWRCCLNRSPRSTQVLTLPQSARPLAVRAGAIYYDERE